MYKYIYIEIKNKNYFRLGEHCGKLKLFKLLLFHNDILNLIYIYTYIIMTT